MAEAESPEVEPEMLVAAVVEAYAALAERPAARPMALEVAFQRIHLFHGLPGGLSRLSRISSKLNPLSHQTDESRHSRWNDSISTS